ncbi:hypothetical protein [Lyngbya sp. PCC 8106]|uniref:hypothetical protein n=1 Tax=Lyngbya sp. (strain PCC 8106) TaxID=313612 RepID=UPI0018DC6E99|nr:hypothetical protein [Lyngbya sp. PCC 8106]
MSLDRGGNSTRAVLTACKKINGGMVAPNTHFWGNVCLANVIGRYFRQHTVLPLVGLFNAVVLEPETGHASPGRNVNSCR